MANCKWMYGNCDRSVPRKVSSAGTVSGWLQIARSIRRVILSVHAIAIGSNIDDRSSLPSLMRKGAEKGDMMLRFFRMLAEVDRSITARQFYSIFVLHFSNSQYEI